MSTTEKTPILNTGENKDDDRARSTDQSVPYEQRKILCCNVKRHLVPVLKVSVVLFCVSGLLIQVMRNISVMQPNTTKTIYGFLGFAMYPAIRQARNLGDRFSDAHRGRHLPRLHGVSVIHLGL